MCRTISGVFGLIHGLAFSLSINHLDLSLSNKLLSILGFNVGIELMQFVIMVLCFPVLLLSQWKFYQWVRISFAGITLLVSVAWVMERVSSKSNLVTTMLESLFNIG